MSSSSLARLSQITALFGGAFDPPHVGHRAAIAGLFQNPGVKRVVVLPSGQPPFKEGITSAEHRLAMTQIALGPSASDRSFPLADVEISSWEIDESRRSGLPSYSFDTILEMRRRYGEVAFVIGTDQLLGLEKWSRFPALLELCHWIVLDRRGQESRSLTQTLQSWQSSGIIRTLGPSTWSIREGTRLLQLVPTDAPNLASTQIREMIAKTGFPPENSLIPEVLSYLNKYSLYGTESPKEQPKARLKAQNDT